MTPATRPTKKQRELLTFIQSFISEHGYSPSYREIMSGLNYTSVATVAVHVNNLITRGHIRKRDHSARSLEVVSDTAPETGNSNAIAPVEEKWLISKVEHLFSQAETTASAESTTLDELATLIGALQVLGLDNAAQNFLPRLQELKQRNTAAASQA